MALIRTTRVQGEYSAANVTLFESTSHAVADNALLICAVAARRASAAPSQPTITGHGLTWNLIIASDDVTHVGAHFRTFFFYALGGTGVPTGGIKADFAGETQVRIDMHVEEYTGDIDTSTPIRQSKKGTVTANTTFTISFDTTSLNKSNHLGIACAGITGASTTIADTWNLRADIVQIISICRAHVVSRGQNATTGHTWTATGSSPTWTGAIIEINEAPVTRTPPKGAIAITGYAPTVRIAAFVTPPVGGMALTGFAPTVAQGLAVAPPAGALALTGFAPTVTVEEVGVQRYALHDLYANNRRYDGRLLEAPIVSSRLSDEYHGTIELSEITARLANGDGALDALYDPASRGKPIRLLPLGDPTTRSFDGIIASVELGDDEIVVHGETMPSSVLQKLFPIALIDTAWPAAHGIGTGTAIDLGLAPAEVIGNVPKVRCVYVSENLLANQYDYIVCVGARTVVNLYRSLARQDADQAYVTLIESSEYTVSTTDYPGYTSVRFTVRQVDFSGGLHTIYADVAGDPLERNAATAIKVFLQKAEQSIDAESFTLAESLCDDLGLYVDFAIQEQMPFVDLLKWLLPLRDMILSMKDGGWVLKVDTLPTQIDFPLTEGDGVAQNIVELGNRVQRPLLEEPARIVIKYRPDLLSQDNTYHFEATRTLSTSPIAQDLVFEFPSLRDHAAADLVAHYLTERIRARTESMEFTGPKDMLGTIRSLVSITAPRRRLTGAIWEIVDIARDGIGAVTGRVVPWSPTPYSYQIGSIPADETLGTFDDFSRVPPAPITDLTFPTGATFRGTEIGPGGGVKAFITVRFTTPASNYSHANVRYRVSGSTIWVSAGTTYATGTVDFMIRGLEPSVTYEYSVQAVNPYGLSAGG